MPRPDDDQLFRSLFEHSADGILITRPEGRILRANPAACRLLQREEVELAGVSRDLVVVQDDALRRFLTERAGRGVAHGELTFVRADGSTFLADTSSALVPTRSGGLYTHLVFRDVSDRQKAREALERYELLARHSRDIILFVARADGRILEANAAAVAAYGYTRAELLARTIHDLRAPGTRDATADQMDEADRAGVRFETEHRRRDGSVFPVEVSSAGAGTADERTLLSVIRDITERRRAEDALREADRRKSEFLGVLSHELRNPLAPIRNSVHILGRVPPGSDAAGRALDVIRRQSDHLARLVDDLLDVTRIERGKILLQRVRTDLREVARRTCDDHRTLLEGTGVALRVALGDAPLWADADPTRVAQALGNLLHNAARFTPAGGEVIVTAERADGAAVLRVRDTGAGMDPGAVTAMFEPFAQGDGAGARAAGGLGLGLALVKGLVELHGGSVQGRSAGRGQGAEFALALPLAPAPPAVAADGTPRPTAAARRLVVVIEDNADAGETLAQALELSGHRVRTASDARSGIALARALRPDVVLCDIGLPDLTGYEVARALRQDPALAATRLVAVSGYAQPEDRQRAAAAGFDQHLPKPPPLAEIERLLASLATR